MLYINAYLVGQVYGGKEEGGWYFQAGTPLAAIPVDSDYKPGKIYYLQGEDEKVNATKAGIHIQECYTCSGTGECEQEDDSSGEIFKGRCPDCGLIPDNLEETWKTIQKYQEFFKDTPGRYEHIEVRLEQDFPQPFPDKKPHYE